MGFDNSSNRGFTTNSGQQSDGRNVTQQSEMVSGNLIAPDIIQNYNSKLLSNKQAKTGSNTKSNKKDQDKKTKKEGNCAVF
jgi:hypothetical protein